VSNGSNVRLSYCSRTILLLSSSSPLLITSVNVPDAVEEFLISNLIFSLLPEGNKPFASAAVVELFWSLPWAIVFKIKEVVEAALPETLAVAEV